MTEQFLKYLNSLKELITLFESMNLSTEIMGEMPLTEEQVELTNVYLERLLNNWEDTFLIMLQKGVKWIEHNKEKDE